MNPTRHFLMIASLLVSATILHGCKNGSPGITPVAWSCQEQERRPGPTEVTCGEGLRFVGGSCQAARCDAEGSGCCPGLFCTGGGECLLPPSRIEECVGDTDCLDGKKCLDRPSVSTTSNTCAFLPVDMNGECPDDLKVYNSRCIPMAPCGGTCADGSVCNIETNQCEIPPPSASGCTQSCGESALLVYADPDNMLFGLCCAVECECQTLPELSAGPWGRFSDLEASASALHVSAYDTTYGDLVVATLDRTTREVTQLDYVDGVPSGGQIIADPTGTRGGIAEPGANVGTYTSIALDPATSDPRIVYHDVDNGDLKFATYSASSSSWTTSLVDDGLPIAISAADAGNVGRFTSMVVDPSGIPHVSYYAHRVEVGGALTTTARYARGKNSAPTGPADWEIVDVEPISSCGTCPVDEVCALDTMTGTPACFPTANDCAASCDCDNECVDTGMGSECRSSLPLRLDLACQGGCGSSEFCVADPVGTSVCWEPKSVEAPCVSACEVDCDNTCAGDTMCADTCRANCPAQCADTCPAACAGDDICVGDPSAPTAAGECRSVAPESLISGLPEGVGLFTSIVLQGAPSVPVVVYYDKLRSHLRAAQANFNIDGDTSLGFAATAIACDPADDVGQHASAVVAPDGTLAIAYQAQGGETLWLYQGTDIFDMTATRELVDDGTRTSQINLVGAGAQITFDSSGDLFILYADQSENDLLIGFDDAGSWEWAPLLTDGAYGSFPSIVTEGDSAFFSTYRRERNDQDRDVSRLVVETTDLTGFPPL